MINKKLKKKIMRKVYEDLDVPIGKNKHFSFIVLRNKIVSCGYSNYKCFHPECKRRGYGAKAMHSELDAVMNFKGRIKELRKCSLVNIRANRFFQTTISKPCKSCTSLIEQIGFKKVYFSDKDGSIKELV